jgi:hypothetical protein
VEAGDVRFIARHNRYKAPYDTVQATFGDGAGELAFTDLSYDYEYSQIINDARLTREGGATQIAKDAASDAEYYTATYEDSGLLNQTDGEVLDRARYIVVRFKDPFLLAEPIRVEPTDANGLFPYVVPLKVADRIRVKRRPQDVGTAIDQECHIEGIEVEASDRRWVQTMTVSVADTMRYWILGVAGSSELGQTTRLGY